MDYYAAPYNQKQKTIINIIPKNYIPYPSQLQNYGINSLSNLAQLQLMKTYDSQNINNNTQVINNNIPNNILYSTKTYAQNDRNILNNNIQQYNNTSNNFYTSKRYNNYFDYVRSQTPNHSSNINNNNKNPLNNSYTYSKIFSIENSGDKNNLSLKNQRSNSYIYDKKSKLLNYNDLNDLRNNLLFNNNYNNINLNSYNNTNININNNFLNFHDKYISPDYMDYSYNREKNKNNGSPEKDKMQMIYNSLKELEATISNSKNNKMINNNIISINNNINNNQIITNQDNNKLIITNENLKNNNIINNNTLNISNNNNSISEQINKSDPKYKITLLNYILNNAPIFKNIIDISLSKNPKLHISPYLPPLSSSNGKISTNKKTLLLDLDETLVHSSFRSLPFNSDIELNLLIDNKIYNVNVLKRPYVTEFLNKMSKLFEVVIFTASVPQYANPLLDKLDINKNITYRLFRQHCVSLYGLYIKDLRFIGRDLKDIILLDNNPISYLVNKDNGLPIKSWHFDKSDKELLNIIPLLEYMAKSEVGDVRYVINKVVKNNNVDYNLVNSLGINNNKSNYDTNNNVGNNVFNNTINNNKNNTNNFINNNINENSLNNKKNNYNNSNEKTKNNINIINNLNGDNNNKNYNNKNYNNIKSIVENNITNKYHINNNRNSKYIDNIEKINHVSTTGEIKNNYIKNSYPYTSTNSNKNTIPKSEKHTTHSNNLHYSDTKYKKSESVINIKKINNNINSYHTQTNKHTAKINNNIPYDKKDEKYHNKHRLVLSRHSRHNRRDNAMNNSKRNDSAIRVSFKEKDKKKLILNRKNNSQKNMFVSGNKIQINTNNINNNDTKNLVKQRSQIMRPNQFTTKEINKNNRQLIKEKYLKYLINNPDDSTNRNDQILYRYTGNNNSDYYNIRNLYHYKENNFLNENTFNRDLDKKYEILINRGNNNTNNNERNSVGRNNITNRYVINKARQRASTPSNMEPFHSNKNNDYYFGINNMINYSYLKYS